MTTLTVNDLRFEVRRSSLRRALEITVDRGGELILSAPPEVPEARLRDFVQRKRMWVYRQLARRDALASQAPRKVFVEGEGFAYLGRSYRLRLVPEADAAVKLQGGRWGYLNEKGKLAIEPIYDEAQPFSEGLAAVRQDAAK